MRKAIIGVVIALCFTVLAYAEYKPKKVKLNALERVVVGMLLPKETSFANWKILNDLKNELSLSEKEVKSINMKESANGQVTAKWGAVPIKEIIFGEVSEGWIVNALKELDAKEKLLNEHISVYEKFIIDSGGKK